MNLMRRPGQLGPAGEVPLPPPAAAETFPIPDRFRDNDVSDAGDPLPFGGSPRPGSSPIRESRGRGTFRGLRLPEGIAFGFSSFFHFFFFNFPNNESEFLEFQARKIPQQPILDEILKLIRGQSWLNGHLMTFPYFPIDPKNPRDSIITTYYN